MDIHASAKREFLKWISTLKSENLNETEKKLINLIVIYFDVIATLGTSGGLRAKKISQLIQTVGISQSPILTDAAKISFVETKKFKSIVDLKIGPFRGFSSEEIFTFDKKYTFMYGPNGSGKSSFCEGLEYALLGEIEEAEVKRINLDEYIKNVKCDKFQRPIINGKMNDGSIGEITKDVDAYRFCFIEKNRIDAFARMSATTPKDQLNRISTLFGLDSFNNFVNGFSDDITPYITLTNDAEAKFKKGSESIELIRSQINNLEMRINEIPQKRKIIVQEFNDNSIKDYDSLKVFLIGEDGNRGIIADLILQQNEKIPSDIGIDSINQLNTIYNDIVNKLHILNANLEKLAKYSSEINYKNLYNAIKAIEMDKDIIKDKCPACKTDLSHVATNPFENAKKELEKMEQLTKLQKEIEIISNNLSNLVNKLNQEQLKLNEIKITVGDSSALLESYTQFSFVDISTIDSWENQLCIELERFKVCLDTFPQTVMYIEEYNKILDKKREEKLGISTQLQKYSSLRKKINDIDAEERNLKKQKEDLEKEISVITLQNEPLIKEIENIKKVVEQNAVFNNAYRDLIKNLKSYRDKLPILFAEGLADKAREFYNIINEHDPDFEKLDTLILPTKPGDKIIVKFKDNSKLHNGLLILSEGHIRALGLSILLAKVIKENLGFIVFDDIVNAIDDDHRNGIARLLLKNTDIMERQLIVTCHGELFIIMLETQLGQSATSKLVKDYKFIPSDSVGSRGVQISIGESRHYLIRARKKVEQNELKDCLTYCRKATESISVQLWRKMSKSLNIKLKVLMREPNSKPDLYSVIDSLASQLKTIELPDKSKLKDNINTLKDKYNWMLLNKGTHEEESLPEFQRSDAIDIVALLEEIETEVMSLTFKVEAKVKVLETVHG